MDKQSRSQGKASGSNSKGEIEDDKDRKPNVANPWTLPGRAQFDMLYPLADSQFSWWYVMVYEVAENSCVERTYLSTLQIQVKTKVICIVCWMQQFLGDLVSGVVGWLMPVPVYQPVNQETMNNIAILDIVREDDE